MRSGSTELAGARIRQRRPDQDLTARAVIRDRALELFAQRGSDAVTLRDIAAAAGVSHGLVVHHFGSKQGLHEAVDGYVVQTFDDLLSALPSLAEETNQPSSPIRAGVTEVLLAQLPAGSPIPSYLRRLLLSGDRSGYLLFRRLYELTLQSIEELVSSAVMRESSDPPVRAAFLLVNDLAVALLRDQLIDVLHLDPLGREGLRRWMAESLSVYAQGIFSPTSR